MIKFEDQAKAVKPSTICSTNVANQVVILLSSQPSSGWGLKTLVETDISFGFGGLVALTFYIDVSV